MIAGRIIHELLLLLRVTTMRLHVRKSAQAGRFRCSVGRLRRLVPNAAAVGDFVGHRSTKDPHRQGSALSNRRCRAG